MSEEPKARERFIRVLSDFPKLLAEISEEIYNIDHRFQDTIRNDNKIVYIGDGDEVIEKFINNSVSYWQMINQKNLDFFPVAAGIFRKIFHSNNFQTLSSINDYYSEYKDQVKINEDKLICDLDDLINRIWKYLIALVKISINHIHEKRMPTVVSRQLTINGIVTNKVIQIPLYLNNGYLPNVNLDQLVNEWKIERIFNEKIDDLEMPDIDLSGKSK